MTEKQSYIYGTSDERVQTTTLNKTGDVLRHQYRMLTDAEKLAVQDNKDTGEAFIASLSKNVQLGRHFDYALKAIEEAVFWAVKSITK